MLRRVEIRAWCVKWYFVIQRTRVYCRAHSRLCSLSLATCAFRRASRTLGSCGTPRVCAVPGRAQPPN